MKTKIAIYCFWVALQIGVFSLGFYIWNATFVPGSFAGSNPYGQIALLGGLILGYLIAIIGRHMGIDKAFNLKK
jgi:hypothetical protein